MTPEHVIIPDAYAFFWYAIPIAAAILLVSALVTIIRHSVSAPQRGWAGLLSLCSSPWSDRSCGCSTTEQSPGCRGSRLKHSQSEPNSDVRMTEE
ncbi:hypothetical protein ACH61_01769 [Rathayibacter tanaceti]|uniref:Uncharacterized protein n=1 Tax=Rathayibacter tanaceti TaxID=1671680 RepID=A0A166HSS6_9MICO|nr:hypothetical protein ACH61_01769 [Rathayibacter tanaceti]